MTAKTKVMLIFVMMVAVAVASCGSPQATAPLGQRPATPVRTATPQPASDEEAIRQLVLLEGQGLVAQDISGLMGLWAVDGWIADAKHTPDDAKDDARWSGRDAIRERYVVLVFPGNPMEAGGSDIRVTVDGETAIATSTTRIGNEVAVGGDRWTFVKQGNRWWIASLTYNLEKG